MSLDDWGSFIRFVLAVILGTSPVFGLVIWFLRYGPDQKITALQNDLSNLGKKVDRMDREAEQHRGALVALERQIMGGQQQILASINEGHASIRDMVHDIDLRAARLEERSDIAEGLKEFGGKIAHAIEHAVRHRPAVPTEGRS